MSETSAPAAPSPGSGAPPEESWGDFGKRLLREWGLPLVGLVVAFQVIGALRAPALPEVAPDFALQDLDGRVVRLADLRGRTTVLNFWATWCGPCRVEIPSFSAFAQNNPDIAVLGIAADGSVPQLRKAAQDFGITYTVLRGDRATLAAYGIDTYPTTVVVDPEGKVAAAHVGIAFRPQLWWMTR